MVDAAEEALEFGAGRSATDFQLDRKLSLAVVKSIEIVGEAASRVTIETRDQFPEVPWQDIIGMRNRLIHVYFEIDYARVADTIAVDLPPLITQLRAILVLSASRES